MFSIGPRTQIVLRSGWATEMSTMNDWRSNVGEGWWPILERLDQALSALHSDYRIDQVKEKFGGLRVYVGGFPGSYENWLPWVDAAEKFSYTICERCGNPGELRDRSWLKTLCDDHAEGSNPFPSDMFTNPLGFLEEAAE